ncbi:MAG: ferredoxin [Candidatus Bathyarchaeota archaeon B23]|nr:MAG: ferredoxin [Candidatus Bathyarchaeota archaeon B23]
MPFKVYIDPREECIGCGNCEANCPEVFELSPEDGLSTIKAEHRGTSEAEGQIPDDLESCAKGAVDLCPVSIIHVEEAG